MRTVWYYTFVQNKKKYLHSLLTPVILLLVLFILSILLDRFLPDINYRYMRWPDMVKDLLGLPAWNSHLYVNLWQLVALFFPIYYIYDNIVGLAGSIIEEERLETIVYLRNMSVSRRTVMGTKALIWMVYMFFSMLILFLENLLFFVVLHSNQMIRQMGKYYAGLFAVSLLYITIAVFIASYKKQESDCNDTALAVIVLPLLIARMYAALRFFGALLTATGREGAVTEKLTWLAGKLEVLTILSPVTWCWPGIDVESIYVLCGVLVGIVMLIAAVSIYSHRNIINMEE